jgi:hypothetical protein
MFHVEHYRLFAFGCTFTLHVFHVEHWLSPQTPLSV